MSPLLLVGWSLICVAGTAGLVYFVMQAQMQVRLSRQRERLAVERAEVVAEKKLMEASLQNAEQNARSKAIDDFLADIRIEERHYVRTQKALFLSKKSMVRQERIFFRNIPLSTWIEQEMPFEEGADVEKLAQSMSVFANALLQEPEGSVRKLLR
jgi:hypothetical protein